MNKTTREGEAPPAHDVEAWRTASADTHALKRFRIEDIVRAAQNPSLKADRRIYNALMGYISRVIVTTLRQRVSTGWKNRGQDIIDAVHGQLIDAVLKPASADGKELGHRFWAVLKTRTLDAIRAERVQQDRYTPSEIAFQDEPDREAATAYETVELTIDLERALECIPDARKALAYRLDLKGVPLKTTKGTISICEVLGVSDKTASQWIKEVALIIKEKIGDGNDQ